MFGLIDLLIKAYMGMFAIRLILPSVGPLYFHPLYRLLISATEPVLRPLRVLLPTTRRGFDPAPIVVIVGLVLIRGLVFSAAAGLPATAGMLQSVLSAVNFTFTILAVLFLGVFFISLDSPFGYSQIGHLMVTITDPLLFPIRRLFGRGRGGTDPAALIGILLLAVIQGLLWSQFGSTFGAPLSDTQNLIRPIWVSLHGLLDALMSTLFWVILIRALLSWFNPDPSSPLFQIIILYSDPILAPIQRVMPWTYGIDFSPMIAMMIIWFIRSSILRIL